MRTDGIFTTKHVRVKLRSIKHPLTLVPFGDIHHDSPGFCQNSWNKFLVRGRELAKKTDVLFLGMGDYLDGFSTSERMVIYSGGMHESSLAREEASARKRIATLAKDLEFMRGRLIGLMGGNHFPILKGGISGDQHLASLLGCDYLGACCAIRLGFDYNGKRTCVDIFAHHGKGGGMTAGGRLNAVEKLEKVCDADIFLMGDNHARGCIPTGERLRLVDAAGGLAVKTKATWIGRTGSFLRGYIEHQPSYVCDAAMPPANLGHIEFTIRIEREGGTLTPVIGAVQ